MHDERVRNCQNLVTLALDNCILLRNESRQEHDLNDFRDETTCFSLFRFNWTTERSESLRAVPLSCM